MALGFLTNREAREQITGLETRVSELESELGTATESLTAAQNDLATANESLSEAEGDLANAKERITELETEVAKIPDLEAAAKITADKVKMEAANLAGSIGLTEPLPDNGADTASKTTHLDTFNTLSGPEKSAYYQANSEAIRKEMTL